MDKKLALSQFYTEKETWLQPHIEQFIKESSTFGILDPFAGAQNLLKTVEKRLGIIDYVGLDIDQDVCPPNKLNDSLINIHYSHRMILTNPPFKAKNMAKRHKSPAVEYFNDSMRPDLYMIALDKCLEHHAYVVAIIPESFFLSDYPKNRLVSFTIIEDNPFSDTNCPVGVALFDNLEHDDSNTLMYKNEKLISTFEEIKKKQKIAKKTHKLKFNDPNGHIGLYATDGGRSRIRFCEPFDRETIDSANRSATCITIPCPEKTEKVIENANIILNQYRKDTQDILLLPFKGNMNDGTRRRKLDFGTARAILEEAINIS